MPVFHITMCKSILCVSNLANVIQEEQYYRGNSTHVTLSMQEIYMYFQLGWNFSSFFFTVF